MFDCKWYRREFQSLFTLSKRKRVHGIASYHIAELFVSIIWFDAESDGCILYVGAAQIRALVIRADGIRGETKKKKNERKQRM